MTSHLAVDQPDVDVLIIGTGFSGLAIGTELARRPGLAFRILERAGSVGGTWRENTYPGAACDIQSHLYSYSFRPNPQWSRVYATQPEILRYLEETAEAEKLVDRIAFHSDVEDAVWDQTIGRWIVQTSAGTHRAKVLVAASGHLADPKMPSIPGLESFDGPMFHSARWDHSVDWAGKSVAIIGTGASAIQIVPELARSAASLTVFQRSAPYVIPREDHPYSIAEQRMYTRMPAVAQQLRDDLFWGNEARFPQRLGVPDFVDTIRATALAHLESQITDSDLRSKLTPDYDIGCKRILISNDFYPAMGQSNVTLETDRIAAVEPDGLILEGGRRVQADIIVVATGFEATDLPIARRIRGLGGVRLSDEWLGGGHAFACATVHGFPNLFVMLGPNTGLGAGSIIHMVESQTTYIAGAVDHILAADVAIQPEAEAQATFISALREKAEKTVWVNGGCKSWYVHEASGELTALWPDFMHRFRRENGSFDIKGYLIEPAPQVGAELLAGAVQ